MNNELQAGLEQKYSKRFLGKELEQYKDTMLVEPMANYHRLVETYIVDRQDEVEILAEIKRHDPEDILWRILKKMHLVPNLTLQGILGMFYHQIEGIPYRKGRVLELFIYAIASSKWAEFKKVGKYLSLVATHKCEMSHKANYIIPSIIPAIVTENHKAGYEHEQFHVITGGKLKEHDGEVCLSHINRLNHTAYSLNTRLRVFASPEFDRTPKYLVSKERYETDAELLEREAQFDQLAKELPERITDLVNTGNKFYYRARYDLRGRTYLKAYHFDYIGNKYIRALTQSAVGETIEWE